ncbi:MAG: hypothetical protein KDH90_24195, partial [Anaerolineae bacterium]|nr:hypothetical protein [Anaerolineae bacterium]
MIRKLVAFFFCLAMVAGAFGAGYVVAAPVAPLAAISLTGGVYAQDFDTLVNSGTSTSVPDGWVFAEAGTNANTTYTAGTGSGTAGDTYSFGAISSTERAFGGLQSGSLIPTLGVEFANNTGAPITRLAVSYYCEQWRVGVINREAADRLDFQYSTDATSLTTGFWVDVDSLDCLSTNTNDTLGAKDGNSSSYRTGQSDTIAGLNIANGATFWLRWTDYNISGSDDGLGVDDFQLTPANPTAVTLSSFDAQAGADRISVSWETVSELDNAGFSLYRSDNAAGPQTLLA